MKVSDLVSNGIFPNQFDWQFWLTDYDLCTCRPGKERNEEGHVKKRWRMSSISLSFTPASRQNDRIACLLTGEDRLMQIDPTHSFCWTGICDWMVMCRRTLWWDPSNWWRPVTVRRSVLFSLLSVRCLPNMFFFTELLIWVTNKQVVFFSILDLTSIQSSSSEQTSVMPSGNGSLISFCGIQAYNPQPRLQWIKKKKRKKKSTIAMVHMSIFQLFRSQTVSLCNKQINIW